MRALLLCLLLLNLGYFVWFAFVAEPSVVVDGSPVVPQPEASSQTIELLAAEPEREVEVAALQAEPQVQQQHSSLLNPPPSNPPKQQGASAQESPEIAAASPSLCFSVGPFVTARQAGSLIDLLENQQLAAHLFESYINQHKSWLIIPPLPSRQEAVGVRGSLDVNQFDSYIITDGEYKNGISVGLFSSLGSAERLKKQLNETGYSAKIIHIERRRKRFWVLVNQKPNPFSVEELEALLAEQNMQAKISETSCEKFASKP